MAAERSTWTTTVGLSSEGPSGHVQPQRILEWMQEAAAHASFLGGYPPARYLELGASWFIHEIQLAVDRPIRCRDELTVETWVSDLRRFRSRRQYRLTVGGVIVARAEADWLLLERDPDTGKIRPRHPDEALKAAFPRVPETVLLPGEIPDLDDEPERAPDLDVDVRHVHPTEIDRHGHVNNVVYLRWVEDHARLRLGDALELDRVRLEYV